MGYTTEFDGDFTIAPALTEAHAREFEEAYADGVDEDGAPGDYCQWQIREGNAAIGWDYEEKFYSYVEWLKYLIEKFFAPRGYVLSGSVKWQGEEVSDSGAIIIKNNKVTTTADHGETIKVMIPQKWIDKVAKDRDLEAFAKRVIKLAKDCK